MFRTQIYLTETEQRELAFLSEFLGKAKSALIRDAIDKFLAEKSRLVKKTSRKSHPAAGLWAKRKDLPNFRELRDEFDR